MMRIGGVRGKDILCVNLFSPEKWKEERRKKVKTTTHTYQKIERQKTIQNQVIKLFMKIYEEKKAKSEAQR